jgi:hypothetical protein
MKIEFLWKFDENFQEVITLKERGKGMKKLARKDRKENGTEQVLLTHYVCGFQELLERVEST